MSGVTQIDSAMVTTDDQGVDHRTAPTRVRMTDEVYLAGAAYNLKRWMLRQAWELAQASGTEPAPLGGSGYKLSPSHCCLRR